MKYFAVSTHSPECWKGTGPALSLISISSNDDKLNKKITAIFSGALHELPDQHSKYLIRHFLPGVSNPVAESLARVLKIPSSAIRIDSALEIASEVSSDQMSVMEA